MRNIKWFALVVLLCLFIIFFFFNDTATTEIYTLSLHDALPISSPGKKRFTCAGTTPKSAFLKARVYSWPMCWPSKRSEEHTSELQSRLHLVCRLLLEKKKNKLLSKRYPSITKCSSRHMAVSTPH